MSTKATNRNQSYSDRNYIDGKEVGALEWNSESALFKLKSITDICATGDADEHEQSKELCSKDSEQTKNNLSLCTKFLKTLYSETLSQVSKYAFHQ